MIKSLSITNFRQHEELNLEFCSGLNVIAGPSASGKSATLKALRWVLNNKPQGDSIYPKGKKPLTEVTVTTNNHTVSRMKGPSVNSYVMDDREYKAFKNDVPEPIKEALNLEDYNIQLQFERHFLLEDSSGEVAAKLNKVANLTIIDESMQKVNRIILQANTKANSIQEFITEKQEQIKTLAAYQYQFDSVSTLLDTATAIEEKENKLADVTILVQSFQQLEEQIKQKKKIVVFEKKVEAIRKKADKVQKKQQDMENISAYVEQVYKITETMEKHIAVLDKEQAVTELVQEATAHHRVIEKLKTVVKLVEDFTHFTELILVKEETLKNLAKEYDVLKATIKICEACGRPL